MNPNKLAKLKDIVCLIVESQGVIAKTRLLKLLFIIDRESVNRFGHKVTGLDYRVWKMGPVQYDVFENLSNCNGSFFSDYLTIKYDNDRCHLARGKFESPKENLSSKEIELIISVVHKNSAVFTNDLIDDLHGPGSLWRSEAEENGVYEQLESGIISTTNIEINFEKLVSDNPLLLGIYADSIEQEEIESLLS